ncbi:hypothetical protein TSUD_44420 [Trifolium subterraneum]|uniref:CCHC-type domain-containing protein n=1 Tax=Trifolium subterraneum TaxID=3900 RepID=A0A2Z6NL94_TRISU|nr:hypothetical protein TSUD_44420 [Trifolium subterraneum]
MLTEEKPEAFASPGQHHENGSSKKKKKKTKKKNNETLPQLNEHPQPQVSSEPLIVTPISESKSNELKSEALTSPEQNHENGSKKKKKKKNNETLLQTNEHSQPQVKSEPLVVTPISEFKSNELKPSLDATVSTVLENEKEVEKSEVYAEFKKTPSGKIKKRKSKPESERGEIAEVVENALNHDQEQVDTIDRRKREKFVQDGAQFNEHNVEPAETGPQISVVDREVSAVDSTIRLNNQPNNEHNVKPAETAVQISVLDREVSQVNYEPLVVTPISEFKSNEEACAEFANTQTGEIKKKKKKKKSVINGEESNEPKPSLDATVSIEFENKKEVEKSEVYAEFAKTQTGEIKKKKKKKKSVINGEESIEPKPSLDATITTEFENKKEGEKSEVYAEFGETPSGKKRKRKSKSETGKMGEVVVLENVLNHDSEQVNEIDRRKRQKSVQDGAQSNKDNVEPAETAVQISVVDRELSPVDPTIRLNNQPANLVEQKDKRKIRQEKHLELLKMHQVEQKNKRKIRQEKHLELLKMHQIAKEEKKRPKKIKVMDKINKDKMPVVRKCELRSSGPATNSGLKEWPMFKSLSTDEEICFFCREIGHSLGKCSVYIAGGGKFARCLFCNLHGHFSFNCPGHGCFQGQGGVRFYFGQTPLGVVEVFTFESGGRWKLN